MTLIMVTLEDLQSRVGQKIYIVTRGKDHSGVIESISEDEGIIYLICKEGQRQSVHIRNVVRIYEG